MPQFQPLHLRSDSWPHSGASNLGGGAGCTNALQFFRNECFDVAPVLGAEVRFVSHAEETSQIAVTRQMYTRDGGRGCSGRRKIGRDVVDEERVAGARRQCLHGGALQALIDDQRKVEPECEEIAAARESLAWSDIAQIGYVALVLQPP